MSTVLLVLLVDDSEYSRSTGAKFIFSLAVFISFPLARAAGAVAAADFAAAAARPNPTPPPLFFFFLFCILYVEQYKAEEPYREDS